MQNFIYYINMKKLLLLLMTIVVTLTAYSQDGWPKQRQKINFLDSLNFVKLPLINEVDTTATRAYARSVSGDADSTTYATRFYVGETFIAIDDSAGMLINYATTLEVRDEIADSLNAFRGAAEDIGDFAPLLVDTSLVLLGAGAGLAGDSVLFAQGLKCFGRWQFEQDTAQVVIVRQTYISAGDSLKFNVYWGNAQTNTPIDSLFSSPQASGEDQETFGSFNNDKIPPGVDVWPAISGTQIAGYRPNEWSFQLGFITIRQ
jgi:hypothetical protein